MVMIGMFMVTREDISTTLLGTILAILAAAVACGLLLLYYMCALDLTWLRVLCVPAFIVLGLLMIRVGESQHLRISRRRHASALALRFPTPFPTSKP